jgi:transcriptional regulator with XRE-family HTH domain
VTTLSDALRREREWIGFSHSRMALALHISEAEYAAYEAGEVVPDAARLAEIAYVCGTTVARLQGEALRADPSTVNGVERAGGTAGDVYEVLRFKELLAVRAAGHPHAREGR